MKRIIVTGARGFVGRHAIPLLVEAGCEVHAVTSGEPSGAGGCTWHTVDLLDTASTEDVIASLRADALLHLAWTAQPPGYWTDPANLRWVSATLELVRAFAEHGGERFVGAGTCAEYDWSAGHCVEGATPLRSSSLYGSAKAACGMVLDSYGRSTGLSVAWGRLFFLFGPHDAPSRLVPSLVTAFAAGEPARCRTGNHVRDFIFAGDAAAALTALLLSDVTGPVNIATGTPMRVADVARAVADCVGRPELLTVEPGDSRDAVVTADVSRLRTEVRWQPGADTITRIHETVRWSLGPHREHRAHQQGREDCA
jgi:nucleoside-diphosphate-sugar epimerase